VHRGLSSTGQLLPEPTELEVVIFLYCFVSYKPLTVKCMRICGREFRVVLIVVPFNFL